MNVVIVHDVEAAFGFIVLIHVFEDNEGLERLEFLVLLELFFNRKVLI